MLKEDQFIRDEVKRVIRQKVVAELEPLRREIVQPLTIDDIVLKLFPGAVCTVWKTNDEKGFVHGIPSEITVDIIEHQGEKYYCDCRNVCSTTAQLICRWPLLKTFFTLSELVNCTDNKILK